MTSINKTIVKEQFDVGLQTYHEHAVVQEHITSRLIDCARQQKHSAYHNVLEIGCGTGFLTQKMINNFGIAHYTANDITTTAQRIVQEWGHQTQQTKLEFLKGDAEHIEFPKQLSTIVSSSTIQWFENPVGFFKKCNIALQKDGLLMFSSFGTDNFKEIKNLTNCGLQYYAVMDYCTILKTEFEILETIEWQEKLWFDAPLDVLKHIKRTGVNAVQERKALPFKQFEKQYRQQFSNEEAKVSLTYHPMIIIAKKR